jgi:putative MATE family efflux protein
VGLSAKITAIVTVVLAGLATGTTIFCAQYWGSADTGRIRQVFGLGLGLGLVFSGGTTALVVGFPSQVFAPFTTDPQVLADGGAYLRILAISFVPNMATMLYSAVLRSTGQVKLPMYASTVAVVLNVVLDYGLIFGHLGLPQLGLVGAAVGTTIARFVEFALIVGGTYATRHVAAVTRLADLRGHDGGLARRFLVVSLPLAANELLWILGESAYAVVYGRMGTDQMAAMSMTFPLQGLGIGLLSGLAGAASVLVGHRLGRGDYDGAADYAAKIIRLGVLLAVVVGAAVAAGSAFFVSLYKTSPEVQHLGRLCILVFCGFLWVKVANMILAGAVLNAGGDSRFVLVMESLATWVVGVPTAFLAAFTFGLPIWWVYLLLSVEEVVRLVVGRRRLVSRKWARSLVGAEPAPARGLT